jgi:hypothetical protein
MFFQKMVLIIGIIMLIIMLVIVGYSLSKSSYLKDWPPVIGECPDYWEDLIGNGEGCYNSKSLGICNIPSDSDDNVMNFNVSPFNNFELGNCAKYKWATNCKVTWDGITSGVSNPCQNIKTII